MGGTPTVAAVFTPVVRASFHSAISSPSRGANGPFASPNISLMARRTSRKTGRTGGSGGPAGPYIHARMAKRSSKASAKTLPAVTIVIEWENAIDVEDKWTSAAMAALQREIADVAPRMAAKPRIMYLYDRNAVDPAVIEQALAQHAPRLNDLADLEIVATDGLTYYKLKNYGIGRARTELSVMLDSDAAPQPGWLENLIEPF